MRWVGTVAKAEARFPHWVGAKKGVRFLPVGKLCFHKCYFWAFSREVFRIWAASGAHPPPSGGNRGWYTWRWTRLLPSARRNPDLMALLFDSLQELHMCCGSTWPFLFGAEPGQHSIEVFRHFLPQLTIIDSWNHSSSLLNCLMDYQLFN